MIDFSLPKNLVSENWYIWHKKEAVWHGLCMRVSYIPSFFMELRKGILMILSSVTSRTALGLGALALLGGFAVRPAAAQTVPNGSFEAPVVSTYAYAPSGASFTFSPTVSNVAGAGIAASGSAFNNGTAPDGNQVAFLQDLGSFSQTITGFVVGQSYDVSFLTAARLQAQDGANDFTVSVTDGLLGNFNPTNDAVNGYQSMTTGAFNATSGTETLTFQGLDTLGGDRTSFVDNVQINPVPEASTTISFGLLLTLGLSGIVVAARKKSLKA